MHHSSNLEHATWLSAVNLSRDLRYYLVYRRKMLSKLGWILLRDTRKQICVMVMQMTSF